MTAPLPVRWHRRVLTLAFPIVLANLTQPILGAVDTAVAGHLDGPQYLGGVALGGLVFSFVFWGFGFLRMGTTGLVAQAFGARDDTALRATLLRALLLAVAIGAAVLAVQVPLIGYGLAALGGSDAVQATARLYCHARIWAAPFALANYVVLGFLLGMSARAARARHAGFHQRGEHRRGARLRVSTRLGDRRHRRRDRRRRRLRLRARHRDPVAASSARPAAARAGARSSIPMR